MKIGLNYTPYIRGKVGGMGVYMQSLLDYFPKISPNDKFFVVCHPESKKELSKYKNIEIIVIPKQDTSEKLSQLLTYTINLYKFDVWYSPLLVLDPIDCPIPCAFTIPDMQHEYFPNYFDQNTLDWRRINYQKSADNSNLIFTLSNDSRQDIIRLLDVDPQKVIALHLDSPPWFSKNVINSKIILNKYNLISKKYLFYPANIWPHKNHSRLLQAFSLIKDKYADINLVFTGFLYDKDNKFQKIINKYGLKDRVKFLGYVKNCHMPLIYRNAIGLVFPSLFEGFGIPVIEAMRTNCPIICSNTTSLPEIAGNAALYFDPLSVNDICQKIDKLLSNKTLRLNLIKKGVSQSNKFSYKKTFTETLNYLKQMSIEKPKSIKTKKGEKKKNRWPKISIITPSYNQGKYIERTIKSILDQRYPNLEYIVMDGGSTDETLDILKKYNKKIIWISEKDKGQTDAINKGLRIATGDIVAYLNSDDTYEKDTFKTVAKFFLENPTEKFVYGRGKHIDENDKYIEDYPNSPTDYLGLHGQCHICQPTAFWKKEIIDKQIGLFNDKLRYAMDYDYWIRVSKKFKLNFINKYLANTRLYQDTKTLGQKVPVHKEIIQVQQRHYQTVNQHWIFSLVHVEQEHLDKTSVVNHTYFLLYIIFRSFCLFIKLNHQVPPKSVFKYYLIWFKQIFVFVIKKQYKSIF